MPKGILTVTITAGQSLSTSADLTSSNLEMVLDPPTLDADGRGALNISFQISGDNVQFFDVINDDGSVVLRPVFGGCAIDVPGDVTTGALYVKIRSGSRNLPVLQTANRVFTLVTV